MAAAMAVAAGMVVVTVVVTVAATAATVAVMVVVVMAVMVAVAVVTAVVAAATTEGAAEGAAAPTALTAPMAAAPRKPATAAAVSMMVVVVVVAVMVVMVVVVVVLVLLVLLLLLLLLLSQVSIHDTAEQKKRKQEIWRRWKCARLYVPGPRLETVLLPSWLCELLRCSYSSWFPYSSRLGSSPEASSWLLPFLPMRFCAEPGSRARAFPKFSSVQLARRHLCFSVPSLLGQIRRAEDCKVGRPHTVSIGQDQPMPE